MAVVGVIIPFRLTGMNGLIGNHAQSVVVRATQFNASPGMSYCLGIDREVLKGEQDD